MSKLLSGAASGGAWIVPSLGFLLFGASAFLHKEETTIVISLFLFPLLSFAVFFGKKWRWRTGVWVLAGLPLLAPVLGLAGGLTSPWFWWVGAAFYGLACCARNRRLAIAGVVLAAAIAVVPIALQDALLVVEGQQPVLKSILASLLGLSGTFLAMTLDNSKTRPVMHEA